MKLARSFRTSRSHALTHLTRKPRWGNKYRALGCITIYRLVGVRRPTASNTAYGVPRMLCQKSATTFHQAFNQRSASSFKNQRSGRAARTLGPRVCRFCALPSTRLPCSRGQIHAFPYCTVALYGRMHMTSALPQNSQ